MLYRVIYTEEPRINNYDSYSNLLMKTECNYRITEDADIGFPGDTGRHNAPCS
jgi:hypothetical protein